MFKITNHNDFDFEAKHHGLVYKFPKGKTVACPEDATAHIFGLQDEDKVSVIVRHGWARPTQTVKEGLDILAKFSFERLVPKLDTPLALETEVSERRGRLAA